MATFPYFVLGPNTLVSLLGLLRGPDTTQATPAEDWREAQVDVVIPTLNEEQTIVLCLASVLRQTLRPRRVVLIDDASTDRTVEYAKAFCSHAGMPLTVIQRSKPIGKTPTIKREARELDCDVEFILDGDTVLESDNYIERAVQELFKGVGIASACGTVLPLRRRDRRKNESQPVVRRFEAAMGSRLPAARESRWQMLARSITNLYREVLYVFLQRFIYHGQMVFFGTVTNPVGCAVAYRRKYVKNLFDYITPRLGDDLTNSEDIFIGFALLNEGYRNVQLTDVVARTVEPEVSRLPRQVYLWSSSFLQSCYYFDTLLRSPLRSLKRWRLHAGKARARKAAAVRTPAFQPAAAAGALSAGTFPVSGSGFLGTRVAAQRSGAVMDGSLSPFDDAAAGATGGDRRLIGEPYRQRFGRDFTRQYGRPVGWMLMAAAVEKVFFPTVLLILLLLGNWSGIGMTMLIETAVGLGALVLVTKGQRVEFFFKGLAAAPVRYVMLASELVTLARFASDVWVTHDRKWRK